MSSTLFSGTSRYSSDFASVISRAVAIASLPMTQLQREQTTLNAESTALGTLNAKVTAVQNAISSLDTAVSQNSHSTSVSNGSAVSATTTADATNGTYTIQVTSLGAYSTAMSQDGLNVVSDPSTQTISSSSNPVYTLNGVTITPASNTLNDLAAAINDSGQDVQATVVNIGSSGTPDYRLALQSTKLGAIAMQLNDGTTDLFASGTPNGSTATYKVNGVEAAASDSRTITLAPGLTVNLLGEATSTITVGPAVDNISNALSSFVNAYNAAVDELDKHRGSNGGALGGQFVVSGIWDSLRSVGQYSDGSGNAISSLTDLGLSFDKDGHLAIDTTAFSDTARANSDQLASFLGSAIGGGFLKAATDAMDGLENSDSGILATAANSVNAEITNVGKRIDDQQTQVDQLQANLTAQMSAADALIAGLEQQATYLNDLFDAMKTASQSYR